MGYKSERESQVPDNVKEALTLCDTILSKIEELPDGAFDFGASVEDKVGNMREWIEKNSHVTDKMMASLENMHAGVRKWLHEDD